MRIVIIGAVAAGTSTAAKVRRNSENTELWQYLRHKLKELPTYQVDHKECKKCKGQNLYNIPKQKF